VLRLGEDVEHEPDRSLELAGQDDLEVAREVDSS
jgi:hypothetical protein